MSLTITVRGVIEKVDSIKVNAYSETQKTDWINKIEGMVQSEILETDEADIITYAWDSDADRELIVKHPYSDLYEFYLQGMIDFYNKEISSYENSMVMFNNAYEDYSKFYKREVASQSILYIKNIW